jgi:3-oxoacyl-[acyl-carrier protein] reductase
MPEESRPRSILVTGSGSGIGRAVARRLAAPGVGLLIHARSNREGCERTREEVEARGAEAQVVLGDLADGAFARDLVDRAAESFGGLDVLIANAGFPELRIWGELDREAMENVHKVVTLGFWEMAEQAIPHLKTAKDGRVVTVSTLNVHVHRHTYPMYPASASAKAGLEALTKTLAIHLSPFGVCVNCVAPGIIEKDSDTIQFYDPDAYKPLLAHVPFGRLGRTDEVAAMVAFLAGPDASYVTNQIIHVNGGIC